MRKNLAIIFFIGILSEIHLVKSSQAQSGSQQKQQSQYHRYLWGTYRPDLLYEYNTIGNEGLAFGIIYHSNKGLNLSKIERCPTIVNQNSNGKDGQNQGYNQKIKSNGGKADKCRSIPSEYEKELRYELDSSKDQIKAEYKFHDGTSYLQELIEEQNEVIMNIKTLKTNFNSLDDQSWSTFINTQRSLPKRQSPANYQTEEAFSSYNEQQTEEQMNLDHSIYFYFVCQSDTIQQSANQRQTFKQLRVVDCFETIKLLNSTEENTASNPSMPQQKLQIKVTNQGGIFTIEDIKNQENFTFEYRLVKDSQLNFRSNSRAGNMRRILQNDLISFKQINQKELNDQFIVNNQNEKGNVLFIKANVKNTSKSIFRISYDSKDREPVSQQDLISLMKTAENNFLQKVQQRILSSYKEVPKPILQISSYALSNILGNMFFIADTSFHTYQKGNDKDSFYSTSSSSQYSFTSSQLPFFAQQSSTQQSNQQQQQKQQYQSQQGTITNQKNFYAQKEIFGISQARVGGNLTPSLFNDGFTLMIINEWDQQLSEMILSNWIAHRDIEGLSYIDNQNILKIIQTSFSSIHMKYLTQSAPSILFSIKKIFDKYMDKINLKLQQQTSEEDVIENVVDSYDYERAIQLYDYAEDILFNLLFSSQDNFKHTHKKGHSHRHHSHNQKRQNKLDHLKWNIDEFTQLYSSSGLDDLFRHKQNTEELVSSVDYITWSIFVSSNLIEMATKLSQFSPELLDEQRQYSEVNQTLQQMLIENLQDESDRYFKDKISEVSHSQSHSHQSFSPSMSCMNTYPFLFDAYGTVNNDEDEFDEQKNDLIKQQQTIDLQFISSKLQTTYGIANSNQTFSFESTQKQVQFGNSNRLSLKGCYESGDISLVQNYLVLRKLFKEGQTNDKIKKLYRDIYNDLLENILKNYEDFNEIYEVYSKQDGKLQKKCRQIPAHAVFLLMLNEDYN